MILSDFASTASTEATGSSAGWSTEEKGGGGAFPHREDSRRSTDSWPTFPTDTEGCEGGKIIEMKG